MIPQSRPRQLPPSRGSKLSYYRASIACVGCRKSKTRCLLTPSREQDSCLNCRRKNRPCAFLTVDKKPPDWIWSNGRQARSESSESSQQKLSASLPPPTDLNMIRDRPGSGHTDTQSSQLLDQHKQYNLAWDVDLDVQDFSFGTLLPPTQGSHADPEGWVDGNSESFVSLNRMGNADAVLTLPQSSGLRLSPSSSSGLGWDINVTPLEYPYNQYLLHTGQFDPTFDPAALARSTPYGNYGYYDHVSGAGT